MKKLPPYGQNLHQLLKKGFLPNNSVRLFIGKGAWEKAKKCFVSYPTLTLTLPAWHEPNDYHWPVKNCDILIICTGFEETTFLFNEFDSNEYINRLILCLYQYNAKIVRIIYPRPNLKGGSPIFDFAVFHKE